MMGNEARSHGQQRRGAGWLAVLLCAIVGPAAIAPATAGAAGSITLFSAGLSSETFPTEITNGPDGNLWFTSDLGPIGKITPAGAITEYSAGLNPDSEPFEIISGPDDNLWFADSPFEGGTPAIGRVTPGGTITEFSAGVNQDAEPITLQGPTGITAGPDGNLWFGDSGGFSSSENSSIGRITPSGTITVFELPSACTIPEELVVGPDDNLWFINDGKGPFCGGLGRIATDGTITEFDIFDGSETGPPRSLVVGPDDNLWFTGDEAIGRMTTAGVVTAFSAGLSPEAGLGEIIVGPDGNLWFTENGWISNPEKALGRITPAGEITEFPTTDPELEGPGRSPISNLVAGPDGNIWFTLWEAIGRMTTTGQMTHFSAGVDQEGEPITLGSASDIVAGPGDSDIWLAGNTAGDFEKGAIGRIAPVGPAGVSPKPTLAVLAKGSGSVASTPGGIACGSTCAGEFASGTAVTLTATPAAGWTFKGWNTADGCPVDPSSCFGIQWRAGSNCDGTAPCELTVLGDTKVSAVFELAETDESDSDDSDGSSPSVSSPAPVLAPPPPVRPVAGRAFFARIGHVRGNKALIRTRCVGHTPCRGVAKLVARVKTRRVVKRAGKRRVVRRARNVMVGRGRFNLAPRRAGILRLRLTGAGKKLLRQSGRRGLRAKVVGRGLRNRVVKLKP